MENTYGSSGGEDVLIQILMCLPIKSLLRFKSVCKSWRELIQSSFFIDLHSSFINSFPSKFGTLILQAIEYGDNYYNNLHSGKAEIQMFTLSSGSGGGGGEDQDEDEDDDQVVFKVSDLEFSPFYKDFLMTDTVRMVGSCNGLICLHDSSLRNVFLWNPATKQFRILPKSITIYNNWDGDLVAFGFDVKTKDYKVVWITTPFIRCDDPMEEEECMCRVQVYNLSTDSWRLLEGINSLPIPPRKGQFLSHGIYMNGSYFFVGEELRTRWSFREVDDERNINPRCNNSLMLSFHFTKEIFTTMQFPDHDSRHDLILSYLGEKMAVFITRGDHGHGYEYCDVWVLNEHGSCMNKESWTKLHSLRIKNNLPSPMIRPKPMCISNNGEFALISTVTDDWFRRKLQLFNLVTKEAKMDFRIGNAVLRADVYKQSLVSIIGGNGAAAATRR